MNTTFKKRVASIRYTDGKMNMVTFSVKFHELPIGCKFRFGYEQDDFTHKRIDWNKAKTRHHKAITVKLNRIVLIDFFLYRCEGKNLNNII